METRRSPRRRTPGTFKAALSVANTAARTGAERVALDGRCTHRSSLEPNEAEGYVHRAGTTPMPPMPDPTGETPEARRGRGEPAGIS
jgi:hypothetical protein